MSRAVIAPRFAERKEAKRKTPRPPSFWGRIVFWLVFLLLAVLLGLWLQFRFPELSRCFEPAPESETEPEGEVSIVPTGTGEAHARESSDTGVRITVRPARQDADRPLRDGGEK